MATTSVVVEVKTRGQRQLEALHKSLTGTESAASKVQQAFGSKLTSAMQRAGAAGAAAGAKIKQGLDIAGRSVQSLITKLGGLAGKLSGIQGLLLQVGAGAALGKAFGDASSLESAQTRITTLVKNYQQLDGIQEVAAKSAAKFRLSQTESLTALTDLGNRLGAQGASLKDIENIYEGFNTLLANNKVEAAQAASATLQLNQALGSGRLAGEEFNAINEATPQLLDEVARVMGVTRGELKQLASDGKISSQVLIQALTNIRTKGAADLESAFSGAYGATKEFQAAISDFSAAIGTELLPVITPLLKGATELLKLFGQLPGPVKTLTAAVFGLTGAFVLLAPAISAAVTAAKALAAITAPAWLLAAGPWVAAALGVGALGKALYDTNETFRDFVDNIGGILADDLSNTFKTVATDATTSARVIETVYRDTENKLRPLAERIKGYFKSAFKSTSTDAQTSATTSTNAFSNFFSQLVSQGSAAFSQLSGIVGSWWNSLPEPIRKLFGGGAIADIAGGVSYLQGAARRATTKGFGETSRFRNARDEAFKKARSITGESPTPIPTFSGGTDKDKGGGKSKADTAAEELKTAKELTEQYRRQLMLAELGNTLEGQGMQLLYQKRDREAEIAQLKNQTFALEQQQLSQAIYRNELANLEFQNWVKTRDAVQQIVQPLQDMRSEAEAEYRSRQEYYRLLTEGMLPAEAERIANFNKTVGLQLKAIDNQIALTNGAILEAKARGATTGELEEQLRILQAQRKALEGAAKGGPGRGEYKPTNAERMTEVVAQMQTELEQLLNPVNQLQNAANMIGESFSSAFRDVISGSKSAQEAFSEMLKKMGDALINYATMAIAKYIAIGIARMFAGVPAAGGGGGLPGFGMSETLAGGGIFSGAGPFSFAGGGYTGDGPRVGGVDGEGGFPALLHPQETVIDHTRGNSGIREAMAKYSPSNGSGGAGGGGAGGGGAAGGAGGASPITLNVTATRIADENWVKVADMQAALAQTRAESIKAGSELGMAKTLRKMQNSAATRRKLGM